MRRINHSYVAAVLSVLAGIVVAVEEPQADELTVPSEATVKAFVTSVREKADSKETLDLHVSFKPAILPPRAMEIYKQKGKIPFSVSVELQKKIETEEGIEKQSIFEGQASIVVVDETGAVVNKKKEDLSALCPS